MKFLIWIALLMAAPVAAEQASERAFFYLSAHFVDEFTSYCPVAATLTGDHRYDGDLDVLTPQKRAEFADFVRNYQQALADIDRSSLKPDYQVDAALLENWLGRQL